MTLLALDDLICPACGKSNNQIRQDILFGRQHQYAHRCEQHWHNAEPLITKYCDWRTIGHETMVSVEYADRERSAPTEEYAIHELVKALNKQEGEQCPPFTETQSTESSTSTEAKASSQSSQETPESSTSKKLWCIEAEYYEGLWIRRVERFESEQEAWEYKDHLAGFAKAYKVVLC